jgi:S1-C subfamily serine protease
MNRAPILAVLGLAGLVAALLAALALAGPAAPAVAEAAVKVEIAGGPISGGHGSGVHIGRGLILTAAHVVADDQEVTLLGADGRSLKARTLWRAPAFDVALLRLDEAAADLPAAPLSCTPARVGEAVELTGHPGPFAQLRLRGHVAGAARAFGPWRQIVPLDLTGMGGVSGGAVANGRGEVVGILVGGLATPFAPISGITVMVPAAIICGLIGR